VADSPQLEPAPAQRRWPDWPDAALTDDLLPFIEQGHRAGRRHALATLIGVDGSSPRPLGAEMVIADDGSFCGYVSGGCIEASVVAESRAVFAGAPSKRLVYGRDSSFVDIVLACGGRIEVLLRRLDNAEAYIEALQTARRARQPLTVLSALDGTGLQFAPNQSRTGRCVADGEEVFAKQHLPRTRLLIVGGGPEALALARLAPAFDIETSLLRPNGPAAPPTDALKARYERGPISRAFATQRLDVWSAVYALSHDLDLDAAALLHALPSPAFVVGALGSRGRAELLRTKLRAESLDEAAIARLQAPAGLDIGAATPMEIALSILGQIVAARTHKPAVRPAAQKI
jgi:xanthine dehydrogenase accessory factor